jgi:hypothetical protein
LIIGPSVSSALVGLQDGRDLQRAAQLLDETLTRIDLIGPDRVAREGPLEGQFDPPDDRFSWQAQIEPTVPGDLYRSPCTSAGRARAARATPPPRPC